MNAPIVFPHQPTGTVASSSTRDQEDGLRHAAYVAIAVAAFVTGLLLGQLSDQAPGGSRIAWPSPTSLQPHPRSLQP